MSDEQLATKETADLIASNKVEGQAVYNRENDHLGTIHNFMVNKRTGQVEYAVLTFGGFLGIGTDHYPMPWGMLMYDEYAGGHGGFIADLDKDALKDAPRYAAGQEPAFDRAYNVEVYRFYGREYP